MSETGEHFECNGRARLFPLGSVVLFPLGLLPLHIFEPRYRQMSVDALADDRAITMVLPVNAHAAEPVPIHPVGCIGTIHQEHRLDDGRFTYVLRGEARVRINSEIPTDRLYRTAAISVLQDKVARHLEMRRYLQRAHILDSFRQLVPADHQFAQHLVQYLSGSCSPGAFADIVSYSAPLPIGTKQQLLETLEVDRRLEILAEEVVHLVKSVEGENTRFPPKSSTN